MKIFLGLLLVVSAHALPADENQLGIIGGRDAELGEFPYQAFLEIKTIFGKTFACGGIIIRPNIILTAAHCIDESIFSIMVDAGMVDRYSADKNGRQNIKAKAYKIHENYNGVLGGYDIALLLLKESFDYTEYVNEAVLGSTTTGLCQVIGWGWTSQIGHPSNHLKKVSVPIVPDDQCDVMITITEIIPSMVCAGYEFGIFDACSGDSGGPLICNGEVAGITSFGEGCGRPSKPGVYTEISYFRDWIDDWVNKMESAKPLH